MNTVVIGGGVAGLAAARRFALDSSAGQVTVLESSERLGGLVETESVGGVLMEWGPDSLLEGKPGTRAWIDDLGTQDQVVRGGVEGKGAYVAVDGKLLRMPAGFMFPRSIKDALEVVRSPVLSPLGKLRLLCEPLAAGRNAVDESVASFVERRFGRQFHNRLVAPVIGGIHSAGTDTLSATMALGPLFALEKQYGSVTRALFANTKQSSSASDKSAAGFISFRQGMQSVVDALIVPNVHYVTGRAVCAVARQPDGRWKMSFVDGGAHFADRVVLATPPWVTRRLLAGVDAELDQCLSEFHSGSLSVLNLVVRRSDCTVPQGSGWVSAADSKTRAMTGSFVSACTFSSQKFPARTPDDRFLFRCFFRDTENTHEERVAEAVTTLRKMVGLRGEPLLAKSKTLCNKMVRYEVGHRARVERALRLAAELGVGLAGAAYGGVGVIDAMRSGVVAAEHVLGEHSAYKNVNTGADLRPQQSPS